MSHITFADSITVVPAAWLNDVDKVIYTLFGNGTSLSNPVTLPSGNVSFLQSGTGAVSRTIQSKEQDFLSVKDFGAVGDGITNDTTAINTAIAAANVTALADGVNKTVHLPAGTYQISAQIVVPYGVSLKGDGDRSTRLRVSGTFSGLTTTGAVRLGDGTAPIFGTSVEDLMIECSGVAGSIGVYSSDIQDNGLRRVLVNNFLSYGVLFDGSGSAFGSVNGFDLDDVECFKANAGGTSGIGISVKNGTFPANINTCQVFGPSGNKLQTGYEAVNFPFTAYNINCDGGGIDGVLLGAAVPNAAVIGLTTNQWTNSVNITTVGKVVLAGIQRIGGTNTVVDAGNGGGVAKTITDTSVTLYARGGVAPSVFEKIQAYTQAALAGGVNTTFLVDKSGAIGTGRMSLYIGDGTGGSVADDAYIRMLNTVLHWSVSGTDVATLDTLGKFSAKNKIYPGTDAAAIQTAAGIYAGSGVPNNANGSNGDFYFRSDGTASGNTINYHKEAAAWVPQGTGTATNDSAAAGNIGEYISSTVATPGVTLGTGTTSNVTSMSLTAGDWDVSGTIAYLFGATTSYTNLVGGVSVTSATLGPQGNSFDYETSAIVPTAGADAVWVVPTVRVSLATTTTVYLVAQGTFTVSTLKAYGKIQARRMR